MNTLGPSDRKIKRKSVQLNINKIDLNTSKIKPQSKIKLSLSPRKKRKSDVSKGSQMKKNNISIFINNKKKKRSLNSSNQRRSSYIFQYRNSTLEYDNLLSKRRSQDIFETQTQKFFELYNLNKKSNIKLYDNINSDNYILNKSTQLNKIEKNIKKAINNMRIEIEKKTKFINTANTISPELVKNKLTSSPNLKIFFKTKKLKKRKRKNHQESLLMKETDVLNPNNSFKKGFNKKRNKSFDYMDENKKKLIKRIKNKLLKNSKKRLTIIDNNIFSDDMEIIKEKNNGFVFLPNSNFIFIFDLLLIISVLYTFIVIPLIVVQNKDLRKDFSIIQEIFNYLIDIIYFLDIIINLFKGYYNYEMNIITNNKKIIIHYLKKYFIVDFLQALPLYSIIKLFVKQNDFFYFGYKGIGSALFTFLFFIKPFKIFKILEKKQSKALEDFHSYLSENFFLENLGIFLIYFLLFFLFVHLFICLHIYLALQGYPNWITYTNLINKSFFEKYIASFYFMITTMTTVGYGDIVCISFIEKIYHIFLLVIGTLLYTFLVSKIGNYLRDESHEQIKLNKDLNILENIRITYPQMPFKLYNKIKSHLLSIFNKRKKTGISLLINGVPDTIKNDLLFKIYSKVINGFNIFKDVDNSNFVLQMLTSFIPIISKKEEIIILEGEIIQNIVFVKDGKLSMEVAIDLNNPYKSIHKYLEQNFIGISRQEELKNHNVIKRVNSVLNLQEQNYNDLKTRIDKILSDNKKTLINNSIINDNGISVDLGRLDFSRNDKDLNEGNDFQIIKIIDIRKNEHFGDVHMFLENPAPFTIKSKSRIAELFLLRRYDVQKISRNFPNIWKRIQNKSYHNLVSIKKLTFKILKQYYNTHIFNKSIRETNIVLNFDATKNMISEISSSDNKITVNKSQNLSINKSNKSFQKYSSKSVNKQINSESNKLNILEKVKLKPTKTRISVNKNKLFVGYNIHKKKNSLESLSDNLNFSSDSFNSNSNSNSYQSSNFKFSKYGNSFLNKSTKRNDLPLIININKEDEEEKDKVENLNNKISYINTNINNLYTNTDINHNLNKKINNEFTFKGENQSNKNSLLSSNLFKFTRSIKNSTYIKSSELAKSNISSQKPSNKSLNSDSIIKNETIKFYNDNKKENNNINDFITLEDINKNFSKKIKKKLKRRKKIQKLRELLKLQRFKINKNLLDELYSNKIIKKQNTIESSINRKSYYSATSNRTIFSKMMNISSSEENNTSLVQNIHQFDIQSIKIISVESFAIKSLYKNINLLSKEEMIKNKKFKKFIESFIKENRKKIKSEIDNEANISSFSPKFKKGKIKITNFKRYQTQNEQNNNNSSLSSSISKEGNKNGEKKYLSTNKYYNKKTERTTDKSVACKNSDKKNKNFNKSFEENIIESKKNSYFLQKKDDTNLISDLCIYKENKYLEPKKLIIPKKTNNNITKIDNKNEAKNKNFNDNNDRRLTSTLNELNDNNNNKLNLKKKKITPFIKFHVNNSNEEKSKKCTII